MAKTKQQADAPEVGDVLWLEPGHLPARGYCYADGRAVGRKRYHVLFARYGTSCGEGNGTTTFNIPRVEIKRKGASYRIAVIKLV